MCQNSNALPENDHGYVNLVVDNRSKGHLNNKFGWDIHFSNGFIGFCPFEDAAIRPEMGMAAIVYYNAENNSFREIRGLYLNGVKCFYEPLPAKPIVMEFTPEEFASLYNIILKTGGSPNHSGRKFVDKIYSKMIKLQPALIDMNSNGIGVESNNLNNKDYDNPGNINDSVYFNKKSIDNINEIVKKFV